MRWSRDRHFCYLKSHTRRFSQAHSFARSSANLASILTRHGVSGDVLRWPVSIGLSAGHTWAEHWGLPSGRNMSNRAGLSSNRGRARSSSPTKARPGFKNTWACNSIPWPDACWWRKHSNVHGLQELLYLLDLNLFGVAKNLFALPTRHQRNQFALRGIDTSRGRAANLV